MAVPESAQLAGAIKTWRESETVCWDHPIFHHGMSNTQQVHHCVITITFISYMCPEFGSSIEVESKHSKLHRSGASFPASFPSMDDLLGPVIH